MQLDGAKEEVCSELHSRLDAVGKQLCDNLDPTETCKVIKTLEEQHVVKDDALQETMERLEAAKRRTTLQKDLDACYVAAEEHTTGLPEGKRTLQAALEGVFKELNEQRPLSPLCCIVVRDDTRQTTITAMICVHCQTATRGAPRSVQAQPWNTTTAMMAVSPTIMVLRCSTQTQEPSPGGQVVDCR